MTIYINGTTPGTESKGEFFDMIMGAEATSSRKYALSRFVLSSGSGGEGGSSDNFYINPKNYGAKGDAITLTDAVVSGQTITSVSRPFKEADIGKSCYVYQGWQTTHTTFYIDSVSPDGVATLDANTGASTTNEPVLFGTDDTDALDAALEAASKLMLDVPQIGNGTDITGGWGGKPIGGMVMLGQGGYLVKNTQARYDAGKTGAITIPRHCGLIGAGMNQTAIYLAPGNVGHGVANSGPDGSWASEWIVTGDYTIFGNRSQQISSCLDNFHFSIRGFDAGRYTEIDSFGLISRIKSRLARRHGFYINGAGENLFYGLWATNAEQNGFKILSVDTRILCCNSGGSGYAGFWVESGATQFIGCKSYYSGSSGGSSAENSCNWFISDGGHSYRKPGALLNGCEAQESRGSSFYIKGGSNMFIGCKASDPKRSALSGGALPSVCAAFHLGVNGGHNLFSACYAQPALGMDWGSTTENHYGGDYAVYIEGTATKNKGTIYTYADSVYDVAAFGGEGITNRTNCQLSIDGDFLPSDAPGAPTGVVAQYKTDTKVYLSWTKPTSTGGRDITDYQIRYKLHADSEWSLYARNASTSTVDIALEGLTYDEEYDFSVAAINARGAGTYSETTTYTIAASVPLAPTGLYGILDDASIITGWIAPSYDGGSSITDYVIEYKLTADSSWSVFSDGTNSGTGAVVTGLTNESSYDFRVKAVNAVGDSAYSSTITRTPTSTLGGLVNDATVLYYDMSNTSNITQSGGLVSQVTDSSGLGNNATQSTAIYKPASGSRTLNGQNVVTFDGVNDSLSLPAAFNDLSSAENYTILTIFKIDDANKTKTNAIFYGNDNFMLWARGDMGDVLFKQGSASGGSGKSIVIGTSPHIVVARKTGAAIRVAVDGAWGSNATASSTTVSSANIGKMHDSFAQTKGDIAAFLVYNTALTTAEINTAAGTLAAKWGMTWTNLT